MIIAGSTARVIGPKPTNVAWVNPILVGNGLLSCITFHLHNLFNLIVSQLRFVMFAATRPAASALLHHVGGVLFWRSKKKMIWPNALRVVAPVANVHSTGNTSDVIFEGENVRADSLFSVPKSTVSIGPKRGAHPVPALLGLICVAEEALLNSLFFGVHLKPKNYTMPIL